MEAHENVGKCGTEGRTHIHSLDLLILVIVKWITIIILVSPDDFDIIANQNHDEDLRILKFPYILKTKPNLNEINSAFPLKLVNQ